MEENLFKLYRKRAGYNQREVAAKLNITPAAISSWESGRWKPDIENLSALADLYGVTVDQLLGKTTPIEDFGKKIAIQPEIEFVDEEWIPVVASLRCGYGSAGDTFTVIDRVKVPKTYKKRYGKEIVACYAHGTSMVPIIQPDDMLICYPGDIWEDGTIAIVDIEGEDTIKRIYSASDGGIDLVPDNPKIKSRHFTPQQIQDLPVCVIGHVVLIMPREVTPIPRRRE